MKLRIEYIFMTCLLLFILLNEQCEIHHIDNIQSESETHIKQKLDSVQSLLEICNSKNYNRSHSKTNSFDLQMTP